MAPTRQRNKKSVTPSSLTNKTTPNLCGKSTKLIITTDNQQQSSNRLVPRIEEKNTLKILNSRLASCLERERNLESENSRLALEVQSCHDSVTSEISDIKSMYTKELSDARNSMDNIAIEKARLEIKAVRLSEENDELKDLLEINKKECSMAENNVRLYESRFDDLNRKYLAACSERDKALNALNVSKLENDHLNKTLNETRRNLEEETLSRVVLENNIQSLKEALNFKDQVHQQELNKKNISSQIEISEIDKCLSKTYENKLQESLKELRNQYDQQILANRGEVEVMYHNKIQSLEAQIQRQTANSNINLEEFRKSRLYIDSLNSRINELEENCSTFKARIRDLECLPDPDRVRHIEDRAILEEEIERLNIEMEHQIKQYQDLMDTKVSLDMEIGIYDKLLSGEEKRLNIIPPSMDGLFKPTEGSESAGNKEIGYQQGEHVDKCILM